MAIFSDNEEGLIVKSDAAPSNNKNTNSITLLDDDGVVSPSISDSQVDNQVILLDDADDPGMLPASVLPSPYTPPAANAAANSKIVDELPAASLLTSKPLPSTFVYSPDAPRVTLGEFGDAVAEWAGKVPETLTDVAFGVQHMLLNIPSFIFGGPVVTIGTAADIITDSEKTIEDFSPDFNERFENITFHGSLLSPLPDSMVSKKWQARRELGEKRFAAMLNTAFTEMGNAAVTGLNEVLPEDKSAYPRTFGALEALAFIGPQAAVMLGPIGHNMAKGAASKKHVAEKAMPELIENVITAKLGKANEFNAPILAELDSLFAQRDYLRTLSSSERTPKQTEALGNITGKIEALTNQAREVLDLDFTSMRKTDGLMSQLTDYDIANFNPIKVNDIVKSIAEAAEVKVSKNVADVQLITPEGLKTFENVSDVRVRDIKGSADILSREPIKVTVHNDRVAVTGNVETLIAAHMLGRELVPVKMSIPKVNPRAVERLAKRAAKKDAAAHKVELEIAEAKKLTKFEQWQTLYDSTQPFKSRLHKIFPKEQAGKIEGAFILSQNSGAGAKTFIHDFYNPIFSKIKNNDIVHRVGNETYTMEQLVDTIVFNRNLTAISERKTGHRFSSGRKAEEVAAWNANLKASVPETVFNDAMAMADEIILAYKRLLDYRLEHKQITQELYNKIEAENYSPIRFHDQLNPVAEITKSSIKKGQRTIGKLDEGSSAHARRSQRELLDEAIHETFDIVAKREVLLQMYDAVKTAPEGSTVFDHVRIVDSVKAGVEEGFHKVQFPGPTGEPVVMAISPALNAAWKGPLELMGTGFDNALLMFATGVTTTKLSAVGANPFYPIKELTRTPAGVVLSSGTTLTGKPLFGINTKSMAFNDFANSIFQDKATVLQMYKNMALVSKDVLLRDGLFRDLANNNGMPPFIAETAWKEARTLLDARVQNGEISRKAHNRVAKVIDVLSWAGIKSEALTRTAVFKQALDRGFSQQEAAAEALRIANFSQRGSATSMLENVSPFFNPGTQAARAQTQPAVRGKTELKTWLHGLTSAATTGALVYNVSKMLNPEGTAAVDPRHWGTSIPIVLGPEWVSEDPITGELLYPYATLPIQGGLAPGFAVGVITAASMDLNFNLPPELVELGQNALEKSAEHYDITDLPKGVTLREAVASTFPQFGVAHSFPAFNAAMAFVNGYDTYRGTNIYFGPETSPAGEYIPDSDPKHTPDFFKMIGKTVQALPGFTPDSGFTSPERWRAAWQSYVAPTPLIGTVDLLETMVSPEAGDARRHNFEILKDFSFSLHLGRDSTIYSEIIKDQKFRDANSAWINSTHAIELALMEADTNDPKVSLTGSLKDYASAMEQHALERNIDPEVMIRQVRSTIAEKLAIHEYKGLTVEDKKQMPGLRVIKAIASMPNAKDRAHKYYREWLMTPVSHRRKTDRLVERMSIAGKRYKIMDNSGVFWREFEKLKREHGTGVEPSPLNNFQY